MNLGRRHLLTAMVLSLSGAITLAPTAHAQQRIAKPGLGFSFVMPQGYGEDDRVRQILARRGGATVHMYLTDGGITERRDEVNMGTTLLTGIYVMIDPLGFKRSNASMSVKVAGEEETAKGQQGEAKELFDAQARLNGMTPEEKTQLKERIEKFAKTILPAKYAYQNSAAVVVDGFPAIAVLTSYSHDALAQDEITVRFVYVFTRNTVYLFYAGYANSEFENRVKAFTKFIQSLKFNERPESEKKQATPSTTSTKIPKTKKQ
jgi:hypothetical protein